MRWLISIVLLYPLWFCSAQEVDSLKVYFEFDKYLLDTKSRVEIDRKIDGKDLLKIQINAHCDSLGSHIYNDALSLKRATEVKNYLLSKQIADTIISINALGKRHPKNFNSNKTLRALNRRAKIVFFLEGNDGVLTKVIEPIDSVVIKKFNNVEIGVSVRLENLHFIGGRHHLLPESYKVLQRLYQTLLAYKTLEVEIQGHICCEYDGRDGLDIDTNTQNLSENRAKAVYEYLVERGINSSRLSYKGFGSTQKLIADEKTEDDKTKNRRVELKIIKR